MLSRGVQTGGAAHQLATLRARLEALAGAGGGHGRRVATGWGVADEWLGGGLCWGSVHEWVGLANVPPLSVLTHLAARAARGEDVRCGVDAWLVCIGREVWPHPGTLVGGGLLQRTLLIDPATEADRHWAMELALRCEGLVVLADASGVDMAVSRRLQLAAEQGQSLGLLARPARDAHALSVATTRWLVEPVRTQSPWPRWRVTLSRCKGVQRVQVASSVQGCALGTPAREPSGLQHVRMPRPIMDDRSLLVEVNDACGVVAVHADIRERRDPAAAAS